MLLVEKLPDLWIGRRVAMLCAPSSPVFDGLDFFDGDLLRQIRTGIVVSI